MTREEAIEILKYCELNPCVSEDREAVDMAIKALKRETILDKVRAEILDEAEYAYADFNLYKEDILNAEPDELPDDDFRYGLERAVEIIDKYKALAHQPSEDTEVIKVSKGAVKARQGRYVIYDVEWLKKNFYATEEKIYGQLKEPCEDCISRKAELDGLASIAKAKAKSDAQKALMGRVMFFTEQLPSVTPKYTDEEIDRAQAVEQAYIDKMVELTVEELIRPEGEWIDIEYFDREWTCCRPKCPFCNAEPKEYSNYCPNCGAKLKEEDPDY